MGKIQTIHKKRYKNGSKAYEKIFTFTHSMKNAN